MQLGECSTLHWQVHSGFGVDINGQTVERSGQRQVCPSEIVTYTLSVDAGTHVEHREVVIAVSRAGQPLPGQTLTEVLDPSTLKPFTSGDAYLGIYETGLYPGALNEIPEAHRKAGEQVAAGIRPLDVNGEPNDNQGRILALNMGHSNAFLYFEALQLYFRQQAGELNSRFELLNAAVGGNQLPEIVKLQGPVWDRAQKLTSQPGYSPLQVQVLFLHTTYHGGGCGDPPGAFPATMQAMQRDLATVLEYAIQVYPNLKMAYLTSDGFRGFTGCEPHVWQEAFAIKWLIESQIQGEAGTAYDGSDRQLPWLTWGPYIWDNTWDTSYFTDGVHPSPKAVTILVQKYWDHLSQDSVAKPWLFGR